MGDDPVGGLEDRAGGAVILLQAHDARVGEVLAKALHVLDFGAAPAVDGLIVIAHRHHRNRRAGQHAQPRVLNGVGVLKLIDENLAKALPVVVQHLRRLQPQFVGAQQQLGKIHHAAALAGVFVGGVNTQHGF